MVVNNDGDMDLGTNGFTSDVSLPKYEGELNTSYGEQISIGKLSEL